MVTLQTADNVLKSFYLGAISNALNFETNPFLAKLEQTSANVVGKDVKKAVRLGISGGIGAGTETGNLPTASGTKIAQFTATLKNLYGTIEISDKAIRASANSEGAFVNLLNDEMQALIKSSSFNFGRMLFGNGTGRVALVKAIAGNTASLDSVSGLAEGMVISFCDFGGLEYNGAKNRTITGVDRIQKEIIFDGNALSSAIVPEDSYVCIQGSTGNELTGLAAIFSDDDLYGLDRSSYMMRPQIVDCDGEISENIIQKTIDTLEEVSGSKVNFILCSWGVRRALLEYYKERQISMPTLEIEGGFKAISFNGIPVVADRFCPEGTMYLLNTNDFKLHQLCDWQWLEGEDGKILKQVPGKPVYTATLVKYAELMCENPSAQGMIEGITEA